MASICLAIYSMASMRIPLSFILIIVFLSWEVKILCESIRIVCLVGLCETFSFSILGVYICTCTETMFSVLCTYRIVFLSWEVKILCESIRIVCLVGLCETFSFSILGVYICTCTETMFSVLCTYRFYKYASLGPKRGSDHQYFLVFNLLEILEIF